MNENSTVEETLFAWWIWSAINSGFPRGYARSPEDGPIPNISDEEALRVDLAVCALKRRLPDEAQALLAYLRCGGNLTATRQCLRCSHNTVKLYVRTALAWLNAALFPYHAQAGEKDD